MRALIYSSNRLFGQCLANALSDHDGVAEATPISRPEDLPDPAAIEAETILLVDFACVAARTLVTRISRAAPSLCVIGLSVDDTVADNVVDCARLGCCAVAPQGAEVEDLVQIMRDAALGRVRLRPQVAATVMRALKAAEGRPRATDVSASTGLTRREREICDLVCEGMTNKEIALEVGRSVATVKNHVHAILTKLDLPRRSAIPGRLLSRPTDGSEKRTSA